MVTVIFPFDFKDVDSLSFLKGKFPQSPVMFVCNKVDITKEAEQFDNSDDDDDDEEEEDDEDKVEEGRDRGETRDEKVPDKEEIVFNQLKERKFLSGESWQSCDLFHAISAKEVRDERRSPAREGEATWRFQRFQTDLQSLLGKVMKTQPSSDQEIVANMQVDNEMDTQTLIPFSQLEDGERALQNIPSLFFIGERKCGKGSIINEPLR